MRSQIINLLGQTFNDLRKRRATRASCRLFTQVSGSSNDEQSPVTIRTFRESHKTMEELDLTELDTLAQLQHVNLVKIFDMVWNINSAGVELYLVYHYCDRGDLALYLQASTTSYNPKSAFNHCATLYIPRMLVR